MNDLCSRFLEVLDSEVDTFWSFSCYMEKFSKDFRADGLRRKIGKDAYNKTYMDHEKSTIDSSQASAVKMYTEAFFDACNCLCFTV